MRTEWNAAQYLIFENQRNQPIIDLLNRIRDFKPENVVDIGCGPGNSTIRVQQTFPQAKIIGIDSSEDMIARAKKEHPEISFRKEDPKNLEGTYDLLFSNACLQWIPNHQSLIPMLMDKLNPGGVFAAQFPMNGKEPLYQIIADVAADEKWGFQNIQIEYNDELTPKEYFNLLSRCSSSFQIWETKYYHNLSDHQALIEWVKGSKLRPYLAALSPEQQTVFEGEILKRVQEIYPVMNNGEVILCFNRFFIVAKGGK